MNATLEDQMAAHQLGLLAIADAALKIRQQPYKGNFGGKEPITLIHYIDSIRGFVRQTTTSVLIRRANGSEFEQKARVRLAEYESWEDRVDELFTIINGVSAFSIADWDWRGAYDDDMSPPDAIASFCEDAWGHDEIMPRELAAICAEVLGDWIPVGTAMQALLDQGAAEQQEWNMWLTNGDRLWSFLNGDGVPSAAIISSTMLEQLRWRWVDGKCPIEALGFWIVDEAVAQRLSYRTAAKFLNALQAGIFDVPGFLESPHGMRSDREYTVYSLTKHARHA